MGTAVEDLVLTLGSMRILHVSCDVNVGRGRMCTAVEDGEVVYVGFNVVGHATCDVTMGRGRLGTAVENKDWVYAGLHVNIACYV